MRIRSVTIGTDVGYPVEAGRFHAFDRLQRRARVLFGEAGLEVQTVRLATQPFPEILRSEGPDAAVPLAQRLEELCHAHGIDYCSIGPVVATDPEGDLAYVGVIPAVIRQTEITFASVLVASVASGINLEAVADAAEVVADIADSTPQGFGNLRFAVLANCGPGSPFFPAAFHRGPGCAFSIATEAADLAVGAFERAANLEGARENLRTEMEEKARDIEDVCRALEAEFGVRFDGIDFSLAPYPELRRSIGHAIEKLGVDVFGASGTLFAVAFIKQVIEEARFPRCGFCGVMLPVLEDQTLAQRSAEDLFTLESLLLYSAVCGTGLDTIPLPGDVAVEELAAILLDVATLSLVVDKPLTARLMPIPGKKQGVVTDFDFPYFADARVMGVRGYGGAKIFEGNRLFSYRGGRVKEEGGGDG